MITLREAASGLLTVVESAIKAGDWKVDGACDPSVEIIRLTNALAKPNKEWVGLTDEEIAEGQAGSWVDKQAFESAVWWAEKKLKEKNV